MKELQDKYHYDPEKAAAAYAVQAAAVQQTNQQSGELDKKHKDAYQAQLEQQARGKISRRL